MNLKDKGTRLVVRLRCNLEQPNGHPLMKEKWLGCSGTTEHPACIELETDGIPVSPPTACFTSGLGEC